MAKGGSIDVTEGVVPYIVFDPVDDWMKGGWAERTKQAFAQPAVLAF